MPTTPAASAVRQPTPPVNQTRVHLSAKRSRQQNQTPKTQGKHGTPPIKMDSLEATEFLTPEGKNRNGKPASDDQIMFQKRENATLVHEEIMGIKQPAAFTGQSRAEGEPELIALPSPTGRQTSAKWLRRAAYATAGITVIASLVQSAADDNGLINEGLGLPDSENIAAFARAIPLNSSAAFTLLQTASKCVDPYVSWKETIASAVTTFIPFGIAEVMAKPFAFLNGANDALGRFVGSSVSATEMHTYMIDGISPVAEGLRTGLVNTYDWCRSSDSPERELIVLAEQDILINQAYDRV